MIPPAVSASLNLQLVSLQGIYDKGSILTFYRLHLAEVRDFRALHASGTLK